MAGFVGGDMIRGHIDTIILNSLLDGDKDTNQIRAEIESRAGGQFQLKQGTFYSALQRIVKQGYVWEYRTTGADGVRRKFFQLTEKGKDLIDKNQSSWTMSRQVINTLLDAQAEKAVKTKKVEEVEEELPEFDHGVTNFSNLDKNADKVEESIADQVISSIQDEILEEETYEEPEEIQEETVVCEEPLEVDEEVSFLTEEVPPVFSPSADEYDGTPQTFDDIMEILEKLDRSAKEEEEFKESQKVILAEKSKVDEEELEISQQVEKERLENHQRYIQQVEIPDEFELAEERSKNPVALHSEETETKPVIPEYIQTSLDKELSEIVTTVEEPVPEENEIDDYLNPDELPTQKEYKDILSKIFAQDIASAAKNEEIVNQTAPVEYETAIDDLKNEDSLEVKGEYDRIVDDIDFDNIKENSKTADKALEGKNSKSKSSSAFDYSDIIAMSSREGFKVNTSDRTNKSELGKILINRLNFHTSLIFFILLAIETILVAVSMEKVLQFGIDPYIYFGVVCLAFPVISGMVYYMAPRRTVSELTTFKNAFETALIVTLNLILLILVYIVIIDLDFSSYQAITRHLFLPLLVALNIPVYIIIRYSLLEKQMYFS